MTKRQKTKITSTNKNTSQVTLNKEYTIGRLLLLIGFIFLVVVLLNPYNLFSIFRSEADTQLYWPLLLSATCLFTGYYFIKKYDSRKITSGNTSIAKYLSKGSSYLLFMLLGLNIIYVLIPLVISFNFKSMPFVFVIFYGELIYFMTQVGIAILVINIALLSLFTLQKYNKKLIKLYIVISILFLLLIASYFITLLSENYSTEFGVNEFNLHSVKQFYYS